MARHLSRVVVLAGLVSLALVLAITLPREAQAANTPTLQFDCEYLKTVVADPIAHTSHSHEFYGNKATQDNSTFMQLVGQSTTCNINSATSSYWHPSLRDNGQVLRPQEITTYYRNHGNDPKAIPYPKGAKLLVSHDNGKVDYRCNKGPTVDEPPVGCTKLLKVKFTFPNCWDRQGLEPASFRYTSKSACPTSHPQKLPTLHLTAKYPVPPDGRWDGPLEVSIGDGQWGLATEHAHADLFVATDRFFDNNWMEPCVTNVPVGGSSPSRCTNPKPGTP